MKRLFSASLHRASTVIVKRKAKVWVCILGLGLLAVWGWKAFGARWFDILPADILPAARDADRAAAEYRAAGMPWEAKDLEIPVADKDNAAPLLSEAFAKADDPLLKTSTSRAEKLMAVDKWDEAEAAIQTVGPGLLLAKAASQKSGLSFHRDWDMGPQLQIPEFEPMRYFVKLLSDRAVCEAAQHKDEACLVDLTSAWRLSSLLGHEPILIGMLVEISGQATVLQGAERCASLRAAAPQFLARLQTFLDSARDRPQFMHALRGEAYQGLVVARNLGAFGGVEGALAALGGGRDDDENSPPPLVPSRVIRTGVPTELLARAFADQHLKYWASIKKMADACGGDPVAMGRAMDAAAAQFNKEPEAPSSPDTDVTKASLELEAILMPVFSEAGRAVPRRDATLVTARALVASLSYRDKTGRFPANSAEIPGAYVDPFTKGPLKIKETPTSFRVYTVGPDGIDHGGIAASETKGNQGYDIVAAYPPLPLRK